MSIGTEISLDDYVSVEGLEKREVGFKFSNPDLFEVKGNSTYLAKKAGKTFAYAFYEDNILASMQVVVRDKFVAPTNFSVDENGKLTWGEVFGYFEGSSTKTSATKYLVQGKVTTYLPSNPTFVDRVLNINKEVDSNSLTLSEEGDYEIKVKALGAGYFDESVFSQEYKFSFGYMREIEESGFVWNSETGVLSWNSQEGEKYKVKFDDVLLGNFTTQSAYDLSGVFENADEGNHEVSVFVYDASGIKIAKQSAILNIEKIGTPEVDYVFDAVKGGRFKLLEVANAASYDFVFKSADESKNKVINYTNVNGSVETDFEGLSDGLFELEVIAKNYEGKFYQSSPLNVGRIYKLATLSVEGKGNNADNGNVVNATISLAEESEFDVNVYIAGFGNDVVKEGLMKGQQSKDIEIDIPRAGIYDVNLVAMPKNSANIFDGEGVFVVNSDKNSSTEIAKLECFEGIDAISHKYVGSAEEFSMLSFKEKDDAVEKYELYYFNGSEYELVSASLYNLEKTTVGQDVIVEFTLSQRIENCFTPSDDGDKKQFKFKMVGLPEDDRWGISCSVEKTIELLTAPTSANSGNSTNKTYSWGEVAGADKYRVEIYSLTKDVYEANKTAINIDTTGLEKAEYVLEQPSFDFESVGYYYSKIYSLSTNPNERISSLECLEEVFFISEKLQLGEVKFGYDEENYKNHSSLTDSSGYYIVVEDSDNVASYSILINETTPAFAKIDGVGSTIYLFVEKFDDPSTPKTISIVGSALDTTLYEDSDRKELTIENLASVVYDDLIFDEITHTVSLSPSEGVRAIKISQVGNEFGNFVSVENGQTATMNIKELSSFSLNFSRYGSQKQGTLFVEDGGKIYLDSQVSTIDFERLEAPSNLKYYNGNLTFVPKQALTEYYIMDILAKTPQSDYQISIKFMSSGMVAVYEGQEYQIGATALFFVGQEALCTISLSRILNVIKLHETLASVYNQATEIDFAVFAYKNYNDQTAGVVQLASSYATIEGNESQQLLKVKKLPSANLVLDATSNENFVLAWNDVGQTISQSVDTTYEIYSVSSTQILSESEIYSTATPLANATQGNVSYAMSRADFVVGTYYNFYVKVKNPYYLESDTSNIVSIYQLNAVQSVTLVNPKTLPDDVSDKLGYLSYRLLSSEADFSQYVEIDKAGTKENNTSKMAEIVGDGTYSFKVVGKVVASGEISTYYIDSETTTWNLQNMSTVKPDDLTVNFENNRYRWSAFAEGKNLNNLSYILVFKDRLGNFVTYNTTYTSASIDLAVNRTLFESMSALSSGAIECNVYATISSYNVAKGGTIYYAGRVQLLNSTEEWNCFAYTLNNQASKLATPSISSVSFESSDLSVVQMPTIKVDFVGEATLEYDNTVKFNIYINDNDQPIISGLTIAKVDEKYTFTIDNALYNNIFAQGSTMTIKIGAVSDYHLPSTLGSVGIERAVELESVDFVCDDNGNYEQRLEVVFDENYLHFTTAGIVLKVEMTPNGESVTTEYVEVAISEETEKIVVDDLKDVFADKLQNGGTVKVSAFINNFVDNSGAVYYLSCPVSTQTAQYTVLKSVPNVINKAGGFVVDETLNSNATKYFVECGGISKIVSADDGFYFEFPNSWTNSEYEVTIVAMEEGCVNSVASTSTFTLDRVARVDAVTLKRTSVADLSKVSVSWEAVTGAGGYIIKMYAQDDDARENLLYSFEGNRNSYSFEEIFGSNYQSVFDFGKLTAVDFEQDFPVVFEVISVGAAGKNNSFTYEFNATIAGNAISGDKIAVNQFGIVTFEVDESEIGSKYLYRFISADRTESQAWKEIVVEDTITKLELDKDGEGNYLIPDGKQYEVEIIAMGNATTDTEFSSSSTDYNFTLDSMPYTSFQSSPTFLINNEIVGMGYREELSSSIAFEMISKQSFTNLYVGLDEDAILNEDVAQINPTEAFEGDGGVSFIYSTIFAEFIDKIKAAGLGLEISNSPVTIYVWSYRETLEAETTYTVSKPYEFTFSFVAEEDFVEIKKMGKNEFVGNTNYEEGYEDDANAFAIFNDVDDITSLTTLGIFVKVTQLKAKQEVAVVEEGSSGEGELEEEVLPVEEDVVFSTIKFVAKEHLSNVGYFVDEDVFVVNLTEIFEHEDLLRLTGKFKVEFSKLQINASKGFVCSDWLAGFGGKDFEFDRMANIINLKLDGGNLYWVENDELASKYYVYFIEELKGEDMGEHYSFYSTDTTNFNASDYGGAGSGYYIGVQAISENPYVISSRKVYVVDLAEGDLAPVKVKRNRLSAQLLLKDGAISLAWPDDCDFFDMLSSQEMSYSDLADALTITQFESPFVFKLEELFGNRITMQMAFTSLDAGSEGIKHVFNVNAKYLLADLLVHSLTKGFDIVTTLTELKTNATSLEAQEIIDELIRFVALESHGIGNRRALFDDFFERLQMGSYKLEYRILGGASSLNSAWATFKNENGENVVYVNPQPTVRAIKEESQEDLAINTYSVIFKKSNVYDYSSGAYQAVIAENYVLKIKDGSGSEYHAFAISKAGSSYKLTALERYTTTNGLEYPSSESVSVYECDSNGNVVANGEYLKFYLNYNNGDSVLGMFSNVISKMTYEMQIYAVGTDYSISSKSEYFFLTFLGLGQIVEEEGPEEDPTGWLSFEQGLGMNKGVFVWTPHNNRNTSVIYKKNTSTLAQEEIVDGSMATSRFSLDSLGYGLFDYIKFVMEGDVVGKTIFVDSEIFQISNVYKLASPTLTNDYGKIKVDDSTNSTLLANCYSDNPLYFYNIYNNVSTSSSFNDVANENGTSIFEYETGTTGITEQETDYARYKATENLADKFDVMSLGTHLDTTFKLKKDSEKYYIYNLYCGFDTTKSVAVRSAPASINAKMMDSVSNLRIDDGILKWDSVKGREWENEIKDTPLSQPLIVDQEGQTKIVYKITWVQYEITSAGADEVETNVGMEHYIYTTSTEFDFAMIDEGEIIEHPTKTYLKATVQAFAANLVNSRPAVGNYLEFVDGEETYYAYGNVKYKDSELFVLMSNGEVINKIDRVAPVEMLEISEGKLVWKYITPYEIDETNFAQSYTFIVEDENGKVVSGELKATMLSSSEQDGNLFRIEFVENSDTISAGAHILKVYASKIQAEAEAMIKSFPQSIAIEKLPAVTQEDFAIVSDMDRETLDLSAFYADGNTHQIIATITKTNVDPQEKEEVVFTSSRNKMFVVYSEQAEAEVRELLASGSYGDYVSTILVVDDESSFDIVYKVVNYTMADAIYSDLSKNFVLKRTSIEDKIEIVWNAVSQQFEWDYDFYSLLPQTEAVKLSFLTNQETVAFNDAGLSEDSGITLSEGEVLTVKNIGDGHYEISYAEGTYFLPVSCVDIVEDETIELGSGLIYSLMQMQESLAIIQKESGEIYRVDKDDLIEPIFIIEATYSDNGNWENPHNIMRVYETTSKSFQPTIIGKVAMKLRVKLGTNNVQSMQIEYSVDEEKFVDYNLFASGMGTNVSPYAITNAQEFKNLAYRAKKEEYLSNYVGAIAEDSTYYFEIKNDIVLSEVENPASYVSGILFKGTFSGVVRGSTVVGDNNAPTISYISNGVAMLSKAVTISEGNVIGPENQSSFSYIYGTSLFEILATEARIENLNLSVEYAQGTTIQNHSLLAGLAITNRGKINKVNLTSFKNGFTGYSAGGSSVIMSYSGLVSINIDVNARISNCKIQADMLIDDNNNAQTMFVAGVAFTNYATIENCQAGKSLSGNACSMYVTCRIPIDTVQVAGIVNTNASLGVITNCENYFNITVESAKANNSVTVYMAGIAGYGKGTISVAADANKGQLTTIQIATNYLQKGDIVAVGV